MNIGETQIVDDPGKVRFRNSIILKALLVILIFFGGLPIFVLFYTLAQKQYLDVALSAWLGEFSLFGIPANPWLDFLPTFGLTIFISLCLAGAGIFLLQNQNNVSLLSKFKPGLSFLLAAIAAIAFEYAIKQALTSYLYFDDFLVIGELIPIPLGVLTLIGIIFLLAIYYWLFTTSKKLHNNRPI